MSSFMDTLYAPFKIKTKHLTTPAIRRMRWLAGLGCVYPALQIVHEFIPHNLDLRSSLYWPLAVALVVLCVAALNPILNTLLRTNKSLDEWEIALKNRAESFAYRVVMWSFFALGILSLVWNRLPADVEPDPFMLFVMAFFAMNLLVMNYLAWTVVPLENDTDLLD